ncbi:hypothetical protein PQX77_002302 [Marasmius sp. AFHP31]|nr:hypothetical protein PQX77_002302 [Marasmius sp. AFHP31]
MFVTELRLNDHLDGTRVIVDRELTDTTVDSVVYKCRRIEGGIALKRRRGNDEHDPHHRNDNTNIEKTVEYSEPLSLVLASQATAKGAGASDKTNSGNDMVLEDFLPPPAPLPERGAWADRIFARALWRIFEILVVILVKAAMK